jgi:hypothetical protein
MAVALASFIVSQTVLESDGKECRQHHYLPYSPDGDPHLIEVSKKALSSHLAHGDFVPKSDPPACDSDSDSVLDNVDNCPGFRIEGRRIQIQIHLGMRATIAIFLKTTKPIATVTE